MNSNVSLVTNFVDVFGSFGDLNRNTTGVFEGRLDP